MDADARRVELELGALTKRISDVARVLPALTAENGPEERQRLIRAVERGEMPVPNYRVSSRRPPHEAWAWLERARTLAGEHPFGDLYVARLDELELELGMLVALGDARRIRPLASRRYGNGAETARLDGHDVPLLAVALGILSSEPDDREERTVPVTDVHGGPSLSGLVRALAERAGLEVSVRVEPRLLAGAATGERVVFLADRAFGVREAFRLATHEVLGHLVAAANARAQPMRLLEVGTAGSLRDQEGMALVLEEHAGFMDGHRRRTIAARYVALHRMHQGASFGDVVWELHDAHGFGAEDAVVLAERTFRGGGVARDGSYLSGWMRVRDALGGGTATVDELRSGRVSLDALPRLREGLQAGLYRPAAFRPSLSYNLVATAGGTSPSTLPPSVATSFTMLELT